MRQWPTAVRVVLVLVAGSSLLRGGPAVAQDASASTLAGFDGSAAASGVRVNYNPQGLLPIAAPVDLGAPDALATITAGPTTFARASVADPGDLLANPSALFGLADPSLSGSVPPYPYRVSATSGLGAPTAEVNPAPGLNARVKVDDAGSTASANLPQLEAPALATASTMTASATTAIDGDQVVVHAHTAVSGFDLLGLLKIGSVVTDVTATSGDGPPKLVGGTKVVGASVLGMPVTIDAAGVHADDHTSPANALVQAIDQALSQMGIHLTVASPVGQAGGTVGQLAAAGLQIDVELSQQTIPALGQLLDLIPPTDPPIPGLPGLEDVLAVARARHLSRIAVGGASVSLATTRLDASGGDVVPSGTGDVIPPSFAAPSDSGLALDPISAPVHSPAAISPAAQPAGVSFGEGLGGLALLALLLPLLLGDRLARWTTTLLADGGGTCPREGRP